MKFDILNIADVRKGETSFLVAMPALAYECEAHTLLEEELDAYEEAVLKFVSAGLSTGGIAHALNASESLISEVLSNLESNQFVKKTAGNPWVLDDAGVEYLKGNVRERPADDSQYGYIFVNPIKKDVLPFFYHGDLNRAPLFDPHYQNEDEPILKITRGDDEETTFVGCQRPKTYDVEKAFVGFVKCNEILERRANNEISIDEAKSEIAAINAFEAEFEGLDSLDEEDTAVLPDIAEEVAEKKPIDGKKLIRLLQNKPGSNPRKVFLTMRVVIDPSTSAGFRISSPFNMRGVDEEYYLRQMQWLVAQPNVYIGKETLESFMNREILKLCRSFNADKLYFKHFAQRDMPHLYVREKQFSGLYKELEGEYGVMQRNPDIREQKNIVRNLGGDVVESLLNLYFKNQESRVYWNVSKCALDDIKALGGEDFLSEMLKKTFLSNRDVEKWNVDYLDRAIKSMPKSHGNGAWEKLVNILVLNYYSPTVFTKRLLEADNISKVVEQVGVLNRVRNLASHSLTDGKAKVFSEQDYIKYKENVFAFVENILVTFEKN